MNAKIGKEKLFRTIGIHSLHDITNENGTKVVELRKSLRVKSTMFPHNNIHKRT